MEQTWLQNHSKVEDDVLSTIREMITEQGNTCVSIIVPTHRFGQHRVADRQEIQKAVFAAKQAILYERGDLFMRIDDLFLQIDFKKNKEGIGLFVSPRLKKMIKFPFPVTKKIVVNKYFHLHDLLYIENYKTKYYLLDISKNEIHLFRGVMDHLEEINDIIFPKQISHNYRDNKPGSNGALKKIFQETDQDIAKLFVSKDIPLLLCGSEKDIAVYRSISECNGNIIGSMSDSYEKAELSDLELLAWLQIRSFVDKQKLRFINGLKEKIDIGVAVCGIEEVWEASKEGAGVTLLVEKDYGRGAFVTQDHKLYTHQPGEKFVRYPDAVNEILTTVLQKKGKVVIAEKDALRDYKRIVLINND